MSLIGLVPKGLPFGKHLITIEKVFEILGQKGVLFTGFLKKVQFFIAGTKSLEKCALNQRTNTHMNLSMTYI